MICPAFQGLKPANLSQGFGGNLEWYGGKPHSGLDWVNPLGLLKGYGTPLVAPIDGFVDEIFTPNALTLSKEPLRRGYGIKILGDDGFSYLYWHCLPIFPVERGQKVKQGKTVVAYMGNSGFVMVGNTQVPIDFRTTPPYLGTHLHQEIRKPNGEILNPWSLIDWTIPIAVSPVDLLVSFRLTLNKMMELLKGRTL